MAKKKSKKEPIISAKIKLFLIILLIPVAITVYFFVFLAFQGLRELPIFDKVDETELQKIQANFDLEIPSEYIPIYMKAGEKYNVPWTLLAAHHRIETRFSTMKTLVSPVGAEGHMQFMPCTFVGWEHPTCSGLGEGKISDQEKTNPEIIKKYGGYGVDADGDGRADPFNIEDAIYSAANFLSIAGASQGEIKKAVFQYNHSDDYVQDILYYYELYKQYKDEIESIVVAEGF